MSDFTDYTETQIRDWMSQGTATDSAPGTVYVALHTSEPSESDPGGTEVGASDYSRVDVAAGSGWNTPDSASFDNANEISFGTATSDWGTVTHVSLWTDTQANGGNCLAAYQLSSSKAISTDDEATFPAGDLSFNID